MLMSHPCPPPRPFRYLPPPHPVRHVHTEDHALPSSYCQRSCLHHTETDPFHVEALIRRFCPFQESRALPMSIKQNQNYFLQYCNTNIKYGHAL